MINWFVLLALEADTMMDFDFKYFDHGLLYSQIGHFNV
jgi:hypothetical protein